MQTQKHKMCRNNKKWTTAFGNLNRRTNSKRPADGSQHSGSKNLLVRRGIVLSMLFHRMPYEERLRSEIKFSLSHQRLATRLVKGFCRLPYEKRLCRLGLHFLNRYRSHGDLKAAYKVFSEGLDLEPSLFFIPPVRPDSRGNQVKNFQGPSRRLLRKPAFSVRVLILRTRCPPIYRYLPFRQLI